MLIRSETELRDARRIWRAFHVLTVLTECGLFNALADGEAHTAEELARRLSLDTRALGVCLEVLTAVGLLTRAQGAYLPTVAVERVALAVAELLHEVGQLTQLPEVLRTGRPLVATSGGVIAGDVSANLQFLAGLRRRSQDQIAEAVRAVRRALTECQPSERGPRVLDLGGGHGAFAAAFAEQLDGADVTLFDRAEVVALARRLSGERFSTHAGDFLKDPLGGPYDVVFLSNILHAECPVVCLTLLRRVRAALGEMGAIVVRDRFLDEDGPGPDYAADFGITLLFMTPEGCPRTRQETAGLLHEAGFNRLQYREVVTEEYGYLIGRR